MKYKTLPSRKYLLENFIYNEETGDFLWGICRKRGKIKGDIAGTYNNHGYRTIHINNERFQIHRIVWKMFHGKDPNYQLDHINGVRDDNRIKNLREVSQVENSRNMKRRKIKNKSGYIGISWHPASKKWRAQIGNNNKLLHIGLYPTIEQAIDARASKEKELGFHKNHGK